MEVRLVPFNGSGTATLAPHPKPLCQIGEALVFLTNSGSVYEPLMGGSFCVGNEVGIEVLAKPIFVRGVTPFYRSAPRTLQWLARPMPGRRTLRLTELDGLRNLPQKFHSAFYIGAEKEKETNLGTRAKTRQSAAQTSIRAAVRAGIFTGSSSYLGLDKKKNKHRHPRQNASEYRSDEYSRRRAGGHFHGKFVSSWVG